MFGIPSPDVVVNLFASLGQVLALLSLLAGGTAVSMRRNAAGRGGDRGTSRRLLYVTAGLMVASWVAFGMYYAFVQDADTARLRRNLVRSSTEAGKAVGDTSLKTLSFSGQLDHPRGMSTEALRTALTAGQDLQILDVRETEETEGGRLPGSTHVRYPDLKHDSSLLDATRTTLLVCYSGNRSSELADEFAPMDGSCRFLIGGYEKWIAEGGALEGAISRRELRALPVTPNGDILIDTPEAVALVNDRNAVFVDVRYPEDFARGHLPGAINLPMRMLRSPELAARIEALPNVPVLVPCYDKRSSFYASILGVRLHRAGREFLGRYTVPHEFPSARKIRAHVAAWETQQADNTLFGMVKGGLATVLEWMRDGIGSLCLAILLLVLFVRGALAPLTFKADVDQMRRRAMRPRVAELQQKFEDDPARAQRAVHRLHKAAGFTPVRNLVVSLGQLMLFLAFFAVVQKVATGSTESLFGVWVLGAADASGVLPILVGVLMGALVLGGEATPRKVALGLLVGGLLTALTWSLSVALHVYLVTSLLWVVVQMTLARRRAQAPQARTVAVDPDAGVVTLAQAAHVPSAGNKAIRLGEMLNAGLPVPGGFALTDVALERAHASDRLDPRDEAAIARLHRRLGADKVAVRSSGLKEDGGDKSYAGVFESVLEVREDNLFEAIEFVRESMDSDRARAYGEGDERGGIVVQAMVPAEHAGVLFTEHPGSSGSMLVELVEGLCEQLVGGAVTPKEFEFTRATCERLSSNAPPIDLAPLLELGQRVEELFGAPQDIEWAFAKGRFFLLQARDVTVRSGCGNTSAALRQRERARLLDIVAASGGAEPDETVFAQNELGELLPDPTRLSLSFMNSLWAPGGSVDLACRSLGIDYDVSEGCTDYAVSVFGRLYVNRREERRRLSKGLSGVASFRLTRGADALEREFREGFLPGFQRAMRPLEALDVGRLSDGDLEALWRDVREDFVTSTYVEAERINIAADFFVKSATEHLRRRGQNPAAALAGLPETVVHRAFEMLPDVADGKGTAGFLGVFGHRARHDFELSEPRYAESPTLVQELARASRRVGDDHVRTPATAEAPATSKMLAIRLDRARRFQALKEEAKHEAMRQLAVLRTLTLEIGRRCGLRERIFWLDVAEIDGVLAGSTAALAERVAAREADHEAFSTLDLPTSFAMRDLERMRLDDGLVIVRSDVAGELVGKRVAGDGEVTGRVHVMTEASEIEDFAEGEILVARFTDPTWSTVFPIAGGLITEVGGWLSHAAIQAREYGLPCVVDVAGACQALRTGDTVRIGVDGSVERVEAARGLPRLCTAPAESGVAPGAVAS